MNCHTQAFCFCASSWITRLLSSTCFLKPRACRDIHELYLLVQMLKSGISSIEQKLDGQILYSTALLTLLKLRMHFPASHGG